MNGEEAKKMIGEAIDRIKSLMREEKLLEAHRACLEILRFDPENIKVIRLKNHIEKNVKKVNRRAIKEDLKNLQPLWKEKKFEELLQNLKKLEPYIPDYPPLKKIIVKARNDYKKQVLKEQEQYFKDEFAAVGQLASAKKFQEAVRRAEKLRTLLLHDKEIKTLLGRIRSEWIEAEIEQNKSLLQSERYEDILLFSQGLFRIDDKSQKVKKLIEETKKKYEIFKIQQKREFIYKGLEKAKTLYQMGKFTKSADAAKAVLQIDPRNKDARYYYKRARSKAEKILDKELIGQMKMSHKQMREEYKKNRSGYIKI